MTPISWGPLTGAGPLPEKVVNSFRGSTYTEHVLKEPTILYRAYSEGINPLGPYWTRTTPSGPVQSIIDSALYPAWGNKATSIMKIKIPAGTRVFEGISAPQGGLVGGGNQVFLQEVDPSWIIP